MYFYCCVYVFLLYVYGTLRLPWLRCFRAFSSVVRQMPEYTSQRRDTARTLPKNFVLFYVLFVLCRSMYCLCVNVYRTTATRWQPNCSSTNTSIHISSISNVSRCYRLIYWKVITTKFTINKSHKNDECHLPSRSITKNLCHLKRTLPTKLPIPCHTATNESQIRRTQILTSPTNR